MWIFCAYNLDFIQDAQVHCRARNRPEQRPLSFPSISFLGELGCVDGIKSCLVNKYQSKCRGLHEQAAINAPPGRRLGNKRLFMTISYIHFLNYPCDDFIII